MYERNQSPYLVHGLEAWKKGVETFMNGSLAEHSSLIKSGSTIKSMATGLRYSDRCDGQTRLANPKLLANYGSRAIMTTFSSRAR